MRPAWQDLAQGLFFLLVVRPFLTLFIGLRVRGREHLPEAGPFVLVANHASHLDTLSLLALFPLSRLRDVRPVAAADYFERGRLVALLSRTLFNIRKKGGNVRSRGGKNIAWTNATSLPTCYLRFTVLAGDDASNDGAITWPFVEEPEDAKHVLLRLPKGARTERTLVRVVEVQCIEYAVLDENEQTLLDPVISIEP